MSTEHGAAGALQRHLSRSDYLESVVNVFDNQPSWDGHIYIYNNKSKKKDGLHVIRLQLKGEKQTGDVKDEITYSISAVDMNNYLNNGGTVFFVVLVSDDNYASRDLIYFALLSPVKIKMLLNDSDKPVSVTLERFTDDKEDMASVLLQFAIECTKQTSYCHKRLVTLDELSDMKVSKLNFSISSFGQSKKTLPQLLFDQEFYVYAELFDGIAEVPLAVDPSEKIVQYGCDVNILIDGFVYFNFINCVMSKNMREYTFGNTIKIEATKAGGKLRFEPSDSLDTFITNARFVINLAKCGRFSFNTREICVKFDLGKLRPLEEQLEFLTNVRMVLDILGIHSDIKISDISQNDIIIFENLIEAFMHNGSVSMSTDEKEFILLETVAGLRIALIFIMDEEGKYKVYDFNNARICVYYMDNNNKIYVSQYSVFEAEHYATVLNINLDNALESFMEFETYDRTTLSMLEMIKAYDITCKPELLQVAEKLAIWLLSAYDDDLTMPIRKLNLIQIHRRQSELGGDDIEILRNITDKENRDDILSGAYLLLGDQKRASEHFDKLTKEEQSYFVEFPIFRFWDGTSIVCSD